MRTFYKVGVVCFSIIFLMGFINFFIQFPSTNVFSKISAIAQLIFNVALILVFKTLLGSSGEATGRDDFQELVEDLNKNEAKEKRQAEKSEKISKSN